MGTATRDAYMEGGRVGYEYIRRDGPLVHAIAQFEYGRLPLGNPAERLSGFIRCVTGGRMSAGEFFAELDVSELPDLELHEMWVSGLVAMCAGGLDPRLVTWKRGDFS